MKPWRGIMTYELRRYAVKRLSRIRNVGEFGKPLHAFVRRGCLILALVFWPIAANSEDLPSGDEVNARAIEVMGGKAAFEELKTRVARGHTEIPSFGLKGTITTFQSRPDKFLFITDLGRGGAATRGYNGDILWEIHSSTGPKIYEGKEKEMLVFLYRLDRTDTAEHFETLETVGIEEIEGEKCYKVVATPKINPNPITIYFSIESGLPVRMDHIMESQQRAVIVKNFYDDYRKAGEILHPYSIVQKANGLETTVTYESIKLNEDVGEDRFEVPEEIKDLK
jgi:outer membrane lipoprotein-sorting protein